ncbi:hypothetical protein L1887_10511 [Cichorium endivia]|nr:hypothetical protein L1887_10511 [Cichorium endivia]
MLATLNVPRGFASESWLDAQDQLKEKFIPDSLSNGSIILHNMVKTECHLVLATIQKFSDHLGRVGRYEGQLLNHGKSKNLTIVSSFYDLWLHWKCASGPNHGLMLLYLIRITIYQSS